MSLMVRARIKLDGLVQGVGFRPFVYRVAREMELTGYVINDTSGVVIEVEGEEAPVDRFLVRLRSEKPPMAAFFSENITYETPVGFGAFEIRASEATGRNEAAILPDLSTCHACRRESASPSDRRYAYPFINCTDCGPRFTIIERLPYDRPNTTMKGFEMCADCAREYDDPGDRRFHAQPNACPRCGPRIWLADREGHRLAEGIDALADLAALISGGEIVAVKGLGGFHLVCDATNEEAVARLRRRKGRWDKPFAVMFKDEAQLQGYGDPGPEEWAALRLAARPVVLVPRRPGVLEGASRGLSRVGAFLPYAPLHHLLLERLDVPVVATSGNLSEEPIVIGNDEALARLSPLVDRLLLHDRPIHRRCDDSVVKIINGKTELIRRSRGYVPVPVVLPFKLTRSVLAVGGHQKNTVAIGFDDKIILSQHIGEMDSPESLAFFEEVIDDLCGIYRFTPEVVVHDLHPRYETTRWAKASSFQSVGVQHHHAHILSCMAEHGLKGPVLGIAWDGSGYGGDGTLWGGEFFRCDPAGYERLTHFRSLKLIGGERAVREPARIALAILFDLFGEQALAMERLPLSCYTEKERELLWRAWQNDIHAPESSSAGRLFDGVASLLGIIQTCSYEAQAAMMVEDRFDAAVSGHYSYGIDGNQIDWRPLFQDLMADRHRDEAPSRFINTLVEIALEVAAAAGERRVCLSGGVFQNAPLRGKIEGRLRQKGFEVYSHGVVPANDGGLSLGQAFYGGMLRNRALD